MSQDEGAGDLEAEQLSILIADVKDYSTLDEFELRRFFDQTLPQIANNLKDHDAREMNSWGDGVIAYFNDPKSAAECGFDLRDTFRDTSWNERGLPELAIRIALHSATVFTGQNPIRGAEGVVGTNVNLTARVEPIVTPNHIFATRLFKENLENQLSDGDNIAFDELYETELAKGWGQEKLYNVRRSVEREISPDEVVEPPSSEAAEGTTRVDALTETFLGKSDADPDDQLAAVNILAENQNVEAIDPLTEALLDREHVHSDVRARIALRLREFGGDKVLEALITAVKEDDHPTVVKNAVSTLGELKSIEAFPILREVIKSPDAYADGIRHTAALSLSNLEDDRIIPVLSEVLSDESDSEQVRRAAASGLAAIEDSKTIDSLIEALEAPEEHVRGIAIEALGELGDKDSIEPLQNLLDNPEATKQRIRNSVISALVDINEPEVVDPLINALDDPSVQIQAAAIRGLGELGSVAALEHLKERLQTEPEPPEIIRKSIAYSLGQIGEPASSDILIDLAIDDSSIDVRTQAITSLGEIAPFDALEELTRLATDIDGTPADVRGNAVGALGEMGYMEAIDATIEAIDDPVVAIQRAAIEAAAEIGGDKAIQKLVSVLDEDAAYPVPVRAKAASDLRYFEDRKVVGALIDILENEEPRIQRSAAISLGRIGDSYATEPLISIVSDSGYDTELRRVAVWALGVISDPESESVLLDVIRDEREPFDIKGRAMLGLGGLGTSTSQRHLEEISTNEEMTQRTRMAAQAVLSQSPSRSIDELKEKVDEGDW